jgi:hypothetical protein
MEERIRLSPGLARLGMNRKPASSQAFLIAAEQSLRAS